MNKQEYQELINECETALKRQRANAPCWDKAFKIASERKIGLSRGCESCYGDAILILKRLQKTAPDADGHETKGDVLQAFQVFFSESSRRNLKEGFTPYDNTGKLTMFFENEVIKDLVSNGHHKKKPYFGVVSHDFRYSPVQGKGVCTFQNIDKYLANHEPDALIFQSNFSGRQGRIDTYAMCAYYHGKEALHIIIRLLEKIGKEDTAFIAKWKKMIADTRSAAIYAKSAPCFVYPSHENHVICKSEVYEQYCTEYLFPAMQAMSDKTDTELQTWLLKNAGYSNTTNQAFLQKQIGINYYPMHPFILERLWSIFFHKNPHLKIQTW